MDHLAHREQARIRRTSQTISGKSRASSRFSELERRDVRQVESVFVSNGVFEFVCDRSNHSVLPNISTTGLRFFKDCSLAAKTSPRYAPNQIPRTPTLRMRQEVRSVRSGTTSPRSRSRSGADCATWTFHSDCDFHWTKLLACAHPKSY